MYHRCAMRKAGKENGYLVNSILLAASSLGRPIALGILLEGALCLAIVHCLRGRVCDVMFNVCTFYM